WPAWLPPAADAARSSIPCHRAQGPDQSECHFRMMTTHIYANCAKVALGLGLLALAGCSTFNELTGQKESIEYKSTVSGDPLSIPPDLTKANQNPHYQAPEGTASYSDYAANQQARNTGSSASQVLPQQPGIQVMRDGTLRWLVVDQ